MSSNLTRAVLHAANKTITNALDKKLVSLESPVLDRIEIQRKAINLIWLFLDQEIKSGRLAEFVDKHDQELGE